MPSFSRVLGATFLIVATLLGSGCAFLRGSAEGTAFVDDEMRHLQLPGTPADNARPVGYLSPDTYQEYARSRADGRAEALYMQARAQGTALDLTARRLEAFNDHWVFNSHSATLVWQQPRPTHVPNTDIQYRRYRHRARSDGSTRACVAFLNSWDLQSDDPEFRPAQGYFGYYCRPPGTALSDADLQDYLRGITVNEAELPGFRLGQAVPRDAAALAQATGRDEAGWGFVPFPFKRTRHYPIGGTYSAGQ